MSTEIIQLCEATLLCVGQASVNAVFVHKGMKSRPLPCCAEHKGLCEERAQHLRVEVEFAPIPDAGEARAS